MNSNPSNAYLDQVRDFLLRQNPNHKGPLLIPRELVEAAARGELPNEHEPTPADSEPAPQEFNADAKVKPEPKPKRRKRPRKSLEPPPEKPTILEDSNEKCGPGRPAHYPPWLKPAAQLVANGYTLRRALRRLGVSIPESQLRQVYRWKLFRQFYEEARRVFVSDWGSTPGRKVEAFTRSVLGEWSVLSLKNQPQCESDY